MSAGSCPDGVEPCPAVLITQRSQVQILPRYQEVRGQGPDRRRWRSGLSAGTGIAAERHGRCPESETRGRHDGSLEEADVGDCGPPASLRAGTWAAFRVLSAWWVT